MTAPTLDRIAFVALAAALPPGAVITEPDALTEAAADTSGWSDGVGPAAVVRPATLTEVQRVLAVADTHRIPVVTRGAGTGLAGGASGTAGSIVLSTDRLNRIVEISAGDGVAVVEPGVITADLDVAARREGLFYPPDPASHGISTIGGNIATNAGGLRCVKYGVTRDAVLALDVVLPGGRLLRTGHRSIKGVAGLDLTSLFVGSEGTLGVIVRATVRLRPAPAGQATLVAVFDDVERAAAAVTALGTAPVAPAVVELLGETAVASARKRSSLEILRAGEVLLLVQTDGFGADAEASAVAQVLTAAGGTVHVAVDAAQTQALLELRRTWGLDPERRRLISEDVAVPRSRLADAVTAVKRIAERHGLDHSLVAHAGDGNLHPSFDVVGADPRSEAELDAAALAAADDLVAETLRLGGTITGEHGVGVLKQRWFVDEVGAESAALQRAVKAVFDPHGILNPGKGL
jgi:glycolate oxidase